MLSVILRQKNYRDFVTYSQLRIELNDSICKGGNSGKRITIPFKKLISNA